MSGWRIIQTIGATSALGRRFREVRTKLRAAEENQASQTLVAKLKEDLASVEFERETAVAILKAQSDAARKLRDSQVSLRNAVRQQIKEGNAPPTSLLQAEQAVATSAAETRQLELLLTYYANLGKDERTSPQDDRNIALELLKVQLEAARNRLRFQVSQSKTNKKPLHLR